MKKTVLLFSTVCLALDGVLGLAACDSSGQTESLYKLNYAELSMTVGESERLELSGNGIIILEGVEWCSSDEVVATVENGYVEAVSAGETEITASYNGDFYTCSVIVEEIQTISLSDTELFLVKYDTQTVSLLRGSTVQTENVTWMTSDSDIATVEDGKIICLSPGEAVITATYEGKTYECELTVHDSPAGTYCADITVTEMENAYFVFDLVINADKTYAYTRRDNENAPDGPVPGGLVNSGNWKFGDKDMIVFTFPGGEMCMRVSKNGTLVSVGELPTGGMDAELTFHRVNVYRGLSR